MTTPRPLDVRFESDDFATDALQIVEVHGREAISEMFAFDVLLASTAAEGLDIENAVGCTARLVFSRDQVEVRRFHGFIAAAHDRLDTETEHSTYRLTFVPRAHALALVETCDIFLDMSVPDIVRAKLAAIGFVEGTDFEMRLVGTYPVREFVVQYKETDLAFLARITEHLGVSFFFDHRQDVEIMIFTDHNDGFVQASSDKLHYRGRGERTDIYRIEETVRLVPGSIVVRDYNYRTPQITLTGQATIAGEQGSVVEYGSHVKTPDEAKAMAQVRAQELLAARHKFEGDSDLPMLSAGFYFELADHPRGALPLLVTEIRHESRPSALLGAKDGPSYENHFTAVKRKNPFRPARKTPKPRISGVITALIDASDKGKYAELDDQGRYKVKFFFDVIDRDGGKASRLVRMAQPHAGAGYGQHFPLRPGVEVMLTFVDGDPDRPIIAATVPNPMTASPVTSDNKERNVMRTGAGNEFNIDDTSGNERIKLSTPHQTTSFQLGSPNSPERGAMLETQGASSTVAFAGVAGFTSIKTGWSALGELREGGNISSVAEKPKAAETVSRVVELMASILETASAALETTESTMELLVAQKKQTAIDKQIASKNAAEAHEATSEAANDALDDVDTSSDPNLAAAIANYKAAKAKYDAQVLDLHSNQEFERDAKKGEADGTTTTEYKYYQDAVANDQAILAGSASTDGSSASVDAARAALDTALAASKDPKAADAAAALTADDAAEKADDDAWDASLDAKSEYDEAAEDEETGETAQDLKQSSMALADAKAALEAGSLLFSFCAEVYTGIKWLYHKVKGVAKKAEALETALAAIPRNSPFTPKAFEEKIIRHTIGSEGNTALYAEENLFMWSKTAALLATEKLLIASGGTLSITASEDAEIATLKTLKLTATEKLDIDAKTGITGKADTGDIQFEAIAGKVALVANTAPTQSVELTAKGELKGTGQTITMTAQQTAKILAGAWSLAIDATAQSATLGNATWRLAMKSTGVQLGSPTSNVALASATATLKQGTSQVQAAASGVSVKGTSVTINGTASVKITAAGTVMLG